MVSSWLRVASLVSGDNVILYLLKWTPDRTVGTYAWDLGKKLSCLPLSWGTYRGYMCKWPKGGASIHFKSVEGMRPGKGTGKSSSPFPSALASPTEQMGWGTFLLKVLSACLGGGACLGPAGGRQPGSSPGLASGTFHRRKSGTLEVQDPSFSFHSTSNSQMPLTKSLCFSQPKNRNSFTFSINAFHLGYSQP